MAKSFQWNKFTFIPYRNFSEKETFHTISQRLRKTEIHNYDKTIRSKKIAHWDYQKFYECASKAGFENVDIFILNGQQVVPCVNELFEYMPNA
ncbi:hypothetical protein [Crocosphaera sp.]|uniref:hypothetical protein n=1 Tax=Crocosphaera sp. TaxID=2729996 RepID=UPI002619AFC1|nr:hypothetical protein [Crocosphaera sp.]MDJ0579659.1 hypothetical protein [Crocosphaera sp.]